MIITKKALPRRTFLRGVGATLALPLLDAMIPALTAMRKAAAPIRRLAFVYVPNGIVMEHWTPTTEGAGFALTPILEPLAPFRDWLTVTSGLDASPAFPLPGEVSGGHARSSGAFLTGVHIRKTEGSDIQAGISVDQIVARALGDETQLASLELAIESNELLGACEGGYSCAVLEYAVLAGARISAPDGEQSTRRLRAAVRPRRHHGRTRQDGAACRRSQYSRCSQRRYRWSRPRARDAGPGEADAISGGGSRR